MIDNYEENRQAWLDYIKTPQGKIAKDRIEKNAAKADDFLKKMEEIIRTNTQ